MTIRPLTKTSFGKVFGRNFLSIRDGLLEKIALGGSSIRYKKGPAIRYKNGPSIRTWGQNREFF